MVVFLVDPISICCSGDERPSILRIASLPRNCETVEHEAPLPPLRGVDDQFVR